MKILSINTRSKNYNIYLGYNIISRLNEIIKKENFNFKKSLIVADKKVPKVFIKKLKSKIYAKKKNYLYFQCFRKK